MLKAYKYRIYPTDDQKKIINHTFDCCRLVYNLAIEVKSEAYRIKNQRLSKYDLCKQLGEMRKEYDWLKSVNIHALGMAIWDADSAFENYFNGSGRPKFKNKKSKQSFRCNSGIRKIFWINSTITVPKIYDIPTAINKRRFKGRIKSITINKTNTNKYFASILVDDFKDTPLKPSIKLKDAIGIDLGITHFAITSDGEKIHNPKFYKKELDNLKYLQKKALKKKKGSKNQKKAYNRLALKHEKIVNKRNDFLHKLSTKIVRDSQAMTICVETLSIKRMLKNKKLSKSISDSGWGIFLNQLRYKCEWYGKNFIKIGRFEASSKICSNCGFKNELLTLKDREWICANCHIIHDRDINAAINIKNIGLANSGWGTSEAPVELPAFTGTEKQENIYISNTNDAPSKIFFDKRNNIEEQRVLNAFKQDLTKH